MINKALAGELKQNRLLFLALAAAGLAVGAAAIAQAAFLTKIIDGAFLGGLGLTEMTGWLMMLLLIIVLRAGLLWLAEVLGFRLAAGIQGDLRQRLLAHLFAMGPVAAAGQQAGEFVNTLTEGINSLEAYFARYLPQVVTAALVPPLILAVVLDLDVAATAIMLVTAPLIPVFMILIGRWAGFLQQRQWAVLSRLSGHFFDVLQGLTILKLFNRSREQAEVVARLSSEFRDTTLGVLRVAFLSALALELLATISTALVAVTVGLKLLYGHLEFGQAFFVLLLAPEYYLPLRQLGSRFHAGMAGDTAAERIYGLLRVPVAAAEAEGEPFLPQGKVSFRFDGVAYVYQAGNEPALDGVSFSVGAGERVALVGPSGAGKSTVADLLLGFIVPAAGGITVNGRELNRLRRSDWLAHVAYVPQFPYLFQGTVAENIRFGLPVDDAAVIAAAQAAGAHEFIMELPEGYDTVVGEGGRGLSGGEAQRLAIARAFYKNAPLLILDEPTSALDPRSERVVREALDRLLDGRTALIIAHRVSTILQADRIVVLNKGRVAEEGGHEELLAGQGLYYRLVAAYRGAP